MSIVDYNKKLITEVQKYPNIFNQKHEHYKNAKLRNDTWALISSTLNEETEEVIRHWKNLRDRFMRIKKILISTGDEGYKRYGNWPYLEDMSFLWEFTFHRRFEPSLFNNDNQNNTPTRPRTAKRYFIENEINGTNTFAARHSMGDGNDTEETFYQIDPTACLMVEQDSTEDQEPVIKRMNHENCESQNFESFATVSPRKDEEELFCQSMVKSLQRFPAQPRAYAKLRIQQVLYETELYANSLYKTIPRKSCSRPKSASI